MIPSDAPLPSPTEKAEEMMTQIDAQLTSYWADYGDASMGYALTLCELSDRIAKHLDTLGRPTPPSTLWIRSRTLDQIKRLITEVMEFEQ